jgi:hypothetical protein
MKECQLCEVQQSKAYYKHLGATELIRKSVPVILCIFREQNKSMYICVCISNRITYIFIHNDMKFCSLNSWHSFCRFGIWFKNFQVFKS